MGKVLFSQVCVCQHEGGVNHLLVLDPFLASDSMSFLRWIPQSKVLSQISGLKSFLGGTPVPGSFTGLWFQIIFGVGYPSPRHGVPWDITYPTARKRLGDLLGQDSGYPPARTGVTTDNTIVIPIRTE